MATEVAGVDVPEDGLLCEVRDKIAYITLNRPERRNALSRAMLASIPGLMTDLTLDPEVWVIVLAGAGDKAFSAGADLKEMDSATKRFVPPMMGPFRNALEAVLETPKPVIASINGYALAGGCELALACDIRIASHDSVFGLPEARIGMGANFASVVLPRLIPRAIAAEMLFLAERISADRALEIGLINRVVPKAALAEETESLAQRILSNAPLTIRRYKEMLHKGWELPVAAALRLNVGPNPYTSEDRREGVRAFLETRRPVWRGR